MSVAVINFAFAVCLSLFLQPRRMCDCEALPLLITSVFCGSGLRCGEWVMMIQERTSLALSTCVDVSSEGYVLCDKA